MLFRRPEMQTEPNEAAVLPAPQPPSTVDKKAAHLRTLGLAPGASWLEVEAAHEALVSDLTPGPNATHGRVRLARQLLHEVNAAFDALRQMAATTSGDAESGVA